MFLKYVLIINSKHYGFTTPFNHDTSIYQDKCIDQILSSFIYSCHSSAMYIKNITPCVNILYHIVNMKINLIFPFYYLTIQLDSLDIDLCSLDLFQLLCKIGIDIPLYVIGKKQVRRKKVTDSL